MAMAPCHNMTVQQFLNLGYREQQRVIGVCGSHDPTKVGRHSGPALQRWFTAHDLRVKSGVLWQGMGVLRMRTRDCLQKIAAVECQRHI